MATSTGTDQAACPGPYGYPDPPAHWGPDTRAVHAGHERTAFEETSEALFLTQGFVYRRAADAEAAATLLARLRALDTLPDLEAFVADEKAALEAFTGREGAGEAREPFRRFPLPGGLEAWVGKHAKGNAELTTRYASPHDLWLHARGVPGSHVVVRRPSKTVMPDRRAVEMAAALAAHYSDARTQALVPVIVTERKYVRPVKGGPPGLVRVDREDVILVEPKRPG